MPIVRQVTALTKKSNKTLSKSKTRTFTKQWQRKLLCSEVRTQDCQSAHVLPAQLQSVSSHSTTFQCDIPDCRSYRRPRYDTQSTWMRIGGWRRNSNSLRTTPREVRVQFSYRFTNVLVSLQNTLIYINWCKFINFVIYVSDLIRVFLSCFVFSFYVALPSYICKCWY